MDKSESEKLRNAPNNGTPWYLRNAFAWTLLGAGATGGNVFTFIAQDSMLSAIKDDDQRAETAADTVDAWRESPWHFKALYGSIVGGNYLGALKHDTRTAVADVMEGETQE